MVDKLFVVVPRRGTLLELRAASVAKRWISKPQRYADLDQISVRLIGSQQWGHLLSSLRICDKATPIDLNNVFFATKRFDDERDAALRAGVELIGALDTRECDVWLQRFLELFCEVAR